MSAKQIIKKHIFIIIPAVIVVLAAAVVVIPMLFPAPPRVMPPSAVTLHEVTSVPVKASWEVVGFAAASKKVDLVARVSGFLVDKPYREGGAVSEGDVLFSIEPEQYSAAMEAARGNLMSAEARVVQARLSYQRTSDLFARKTSPKSDLDDSKAALDVAEAGLISARAAFSQAQLDLGYATVKAPFDGYASDSPFSEGAFLSPSSGILATVVASDPLEISFGVPDRFMAALKAGAPDSALPRGGVDEVAVKVRSAGGREYPLTGSVTYVAPLVNEGTGTYKVKALMPNPDGILAPGETLTVILEDAQPRQAVLVPKSSVMVSADSGSYVYAAGPAPPGPDGSPGQGLVAQKIDVRRGNEFPGGIEILEGLKPGDKIIELGLMSMGSMLRPGAPVRVIEGSGTAGGGAPGGPGAGSPGGSAPAGAGADAGSPGADSAAAGADAGSPGSASPAVAGAGAGAGSSGAASPAGAGAGSSGVAGGGA
ncbi:MAG: efflux RND transporter periplasmic adaptor subunit [Deltaproteobacteria bacterium]|jgi:membrane fusion protein (multidrug efflux system)|nr:efflux RND transporter periplasmic adaptor subunit [Deltaproteobacteria bacterium]